MVPADTTVVHFPVRRAEHHLVGVYYLAGTQDPAPFVLLLHGIPGAEKNHDLAQHLRADGWHVLVLHFSGAWGSGGDYDIAGQVDDTHAALDFVLNDEAPAQIDQSRIAVIGFSLGSRAALHATADDSRIKAAVSIAGFCDFADALLGAGFLAACAPFLAGMTGDSLAVQWMQIGEGLQPIEALAQIAPRPVLIVHGTEDEIVPFFHADGFMMNAGDHVLRAAIAGSNHVFGDYRSQLIMVVGDFLKVAF